MRYALLIGSGIDNAGGDTILEQYITYFKKQNIDFDAFAYHKNLYGFGTTNIRKIDDVTFYDNYNDKFLDTINSYDVIIIMNSPKKIFVKESEEFIEFVTKIQKKVIVFLIDRTKSGFKFSTFDERILRKASIVNVFVDKSARWYKELEKIEGLVIKQWDINLFDFENMTSLPFEKKRREITFAGRFASLKGARYMMSCFEKNLLDKRFYYTMQGSKFNYDKQSNTVSGTIGDVMTYTYYAQNGSKQLKTFFSVKDSYELYEYLHDYGHLVLYPEYNKKEMLDRIKGSSYMMYLYRYGKTGKGIFYTGLEYAIFESISVGTPIITTKTFGREMIVNGKPLIEHDCGLIFVEPDLSDLSVEIDNYEKNYDENVKTMQNWLVREYDNDRRFKEMENEIKAVKIR